ncbi:MAG: cobB: cobyrinic acid a,c-diamide synthase [Actinobacteria bacterium]|nr:cobB: cobyrinic acid a,c-diamide synthase [Actinomycetota bacterium]
MPTLGPRIVISGTHSGVGKTTVATGLMAALASRGRRVVSAKVGPDFIDPGYHSLTTGCPGRSLDAWLSGEENLAALAAAGTEGADLLIVEGVMGLFDGTAQPGCDGSTAAVARLLEAPVVLVVDASAMSGSVAAVVHGYRDLDRRVDVAGVILNRVGGEGHAILLREALEPLGVPVLGVVHDDDALAWRERHLGLVPVAEHPDAVRAALTRLGAAIEASCDLAAIEAIARAAPGRTVPPAPQARPVASVRLALAAGPAFSFTYPENLALLQQAGAELVPFDPLEDPHLPAGCDALYAGGGFPEVFAPALAGNLPLLQSVRHAVAGGLVAWAECGGLLWLCRRLDGKPMVGAIPAEARMTEQLTIGYRSAVTRVVSPFGAPGVDLRGHEFHRTVAEPAGDALALTGCFGEGRAGFASPTMFASYLHQHIATSPAIAERFVAAAAGQGLRATQPTI